MIRCIVIGNAFDAEGRADLSMVIVDTDTGEILSRRTCEWFNRTRAVIDRTGQITWVKVADWRHRVVT